MRLWHTLRLCRFDVLPVAALSYAVGAGLSGGFGREDFWPAVLVAVVSTNFIYAFNAWTDRRADAVNKPWRPLPAGKISSRWALTYSMILLAMSVVYPWCLTRDIALVGLYLLLPLLGLAYSAPPLRLKRFPALAVGVVALGLVTPCMIAMLNPPRQSGAWGMVALLFVFCCAVVPLKDIEDAPGDLADGIHNLYSRYGLGVVMASLGLQCLALMVQLRMPIPLHHRLILLSIQGAALGTTVVFAATGWPVQHLYRWLIRLVVLAGGLAWAMG